MLDLIQQHFSILFFITGLISLSIGSFLNVLIYRLPQMLYQESQPSSKIFNLFFPSSHCPKCQHTLRWCDNIPVTSYCYLQGKCRHCQQSISPQYFIVELITVIISLFLIWRFHLSWQTAATLFFSWYLIALTAIDLNEHLLPDLLTLSLLWLGLIANLFNLFTDINSAVMGASIGYISLWCVNKLFAAITGKIGMGHGDFKLYAALGAWLGWQALPFIILIAAISGSVVGLTLIIIKGYKRDAAIAFGPYLAMAGWIYLFLK